MPKLQELYLEFDGGKTGSLTNGEFDFGIQHLPCLALVGRDYLSKYHDPDDPTWEALEKAASSHPNHPKLHMTNLPWW